MTERYLNKKQTFHHKLVLKDLCFQDCALSEWSEWSTCTKTCDGGQQTRTRHIIQHAENGGQQCYEEQSQTHNCNDQACRT